MRAPVDPNCNCAVDAGFVIVSELLGILHVRFDEAAKVLSPELYWMLPVAPAGDPVGPVGPVYPVIPTELAPITSIIRQLARSVESTVVFVGIVIVKVCKPAAILEEVNVEGIVACTAVALKLKVDVQVGVPSIATEKAADPATVANAEKLKSKTFVPPAAVHVPVQATLEPAPALVGAVSENT